MYKIRYYNRFHDYKTEKSFTDKLEKSVDKTIEQLAGGDLKSAQLHKLKGSKYDSAKINHTHRILCDRVCVNSVNYIRIYELIPNHAYDKSKFQNGRKINLETDLIDLEAIENKDIPNIETTDTFSIHNQNQIYKTIFLSLKQDEILDMTPPLMVVGSAGSGKTTVSIEMMKKLEGKILYISLSQILVDKSKGLYDGEENKVDFLSFNSFLNRVDKQTNEEITLSTFKNFARDFYIDSKNVEQYFEEFRGVICGVYNKKYLELDQYLDEDLGVKNSLFNEKDREEVYPKFIQYLEYLKKNNLYDSNIICSELLGKVNKEYNYIFIDEIQDLTSIQTHFIRESLHEKMAHNFIMSGDAHQIVYNNFFSFTKLGVMLYETQSDKGVSYDESIIKILKTNYRNSKCITEVANKILKIKQLRFGAIDSVSNHLIETSSLEDGEIHLYKSTPSNIKIIKDNIKDDVKSVVIVLNEEMKIQAREHFDAALLLTVQEVKGLEYEEVILYNFISNERKIFNDICTHQQTKTETNYKTPKKDLSQKDVENKLGDGGIKDNTNKDLEILKIYINSLYVSLTRAMLTVHILESDSNHKMLELLELEEEGSVKVDIKTSTNEEWEKERQRQLKAGNVEQARLIEEKRKKDTFQKTEIIVKKKVVKQHIQKKKVLVSIDYEDEKAKFFSIETPNKIDKAKYFKLAKNENDIHSIQKLADDLSFKNAIEYLKKHYQNLFNESVSNKDINLLKEVIVKDISFKNINIVSILKTHELEFIKLLLKKGLNVDYRDEYSKTALMRSVEENNFERVKLLVNNGANVDIYSKLKVTPLLEASSKGYIEIVKLLVNHGANVNLKGFQNARALFMASQGGFLEIVEFLLENNAEINVGCKENRTALIIASQNGYFDIVKLLLNKGSDINTRVDDGRTALMQASVHGHIDIVKLLVDDNRIDINLFDDERNTALTLSASSEIIKLLVNYDADVGFIAQSGYTILHRVIEDKRDDVIKLLLQKVNNVNLKRDDGYTPIFMAANFSTKETIEQLLEYGANIYETIKGSNVLHVAASNNTFDVVKYFVDKKIDVNAKNENGLTPFLASLNKGKDEEIILLLLNSGADINYTNLKNRSTPLMMAADFGYLKTVKLLIEKGANLESKNRDGYTALDIARKQKNYEIIEFLEKAIKEKNRWKKIFSY